MGVLTQIDNMTTGLISPPLPVQPVQEPVATMKMLHTYGDTTPPKRPWVGLTAQEAADCWTTSATKTWHNFEAALKEKNGIQ